MKHVISIILRAGEAAETKAHFRERNAEAFARDDNHERAENLRAQAALDRQIAEECREVLPLLQIMTSVKASISGLSESDLKEVQKAMIADLHAELEVEGCDQLGTLVTALTNIANECPGGEIGDPEADRILARISDIANGALDSVSP